MLLLVVVAVVAVDQVTKYVAQSRLVDGSFFEQTESYPCCRGGEEELERRRFVRSKRNSLVVVDGFFNLRYVENCASAFGMLGNVSESIRFPLFIAATCIAVLFFLPYFVLQITPEYPLTLYGLAFVEGGAIGNLVDRLSHRYVIDFIEWYIIIDGRSFHWPTFNVADVAIVVGMGLILLEIAMRRPTP